MSTSRERVLTAIARKQPDRTPADYKAEPEVNAALMAQLGMGDYEPLLGRLQVDVRRIEPRYQGPPKKALADGITADFWGIRARTMRTSVASFDMFVETDLWKAASVEPLERHPWPSPDIFDYR